MARVVNAPFWLASLVYAYAVYLLSTLFVTNALRWTGAMAVACVAYVMVLLPVVAIWRSDSGHVAPVYAVGMALATMGGTWIAGLIFQPRHRQLGMLACIGLGALFPVLLAAISTSAAPVREMQYLYLAATAAGGCIALAMQSPMRGTAMARIGRS